MQINKAITFIVALFAALAAAIPYLAPALKLSPEAASGIGALCVLIVGQLNKMVSKPVDPASIDIKVQ